MPNHVIIFMCTAFLFSFARSMETAVAKALTVFSQLSIFTADCLRQMAGVEIRASRMHTKCRWEPFPLSLYLSRC